MKSLTGDSVAHAQVSTEDPSGGVYLQLRARLEELHRQRIIRSSLIRKCEAAVEKRHLEEDA